MMRKYTWLFLLFLGSMVKAQDLSVGLSAGLIRATYDTKDLEDIESMSYANGFTFGVTVEYPISDVFGLKSGLNLYQKGTEQTISGNSILHVTNEATGRDRLFTGFREQKLVVSNTYVSLPIGIYGTFWDRVQIYGTFDFGFLLSSSGSGSMKFTTGGVDYDATLTHRYKKDKAGEGTGTLTSIGSTDFSLQSQLGAYYEYDTKEANLYNNFDIGANLGLNVFLTKSLYVGARYDIGLLDITNSKSDRSYVNASNGKLSFRDDVDKNSAYEFLVGFSF